jgi:hypothetical protein
VPTLLERRRVWPVTTALLGLALLGGGLWLAA